MSTPVKQDWDVSVREGGMGGSNVAVPRGGPSWRRYMAYIGPGALVAVGYMDPGNWATNVAGGSAYGYTLLAVILGSSLMAMVLQTLALRLGVATGRDLAQMCRDVYRGPVRWILWLLAEIAIIATDLAEVVGAAIALNLLFGLPLLWGVIITGLDVFLILGLQRRGLRWLEAFVIVLIGTVAVCFGIELVLAKPDWGGVVRGYAPSLQIVQNAAMLYIAIGILGATVMPHNLYLHSASLQTRDYPRTPEGRREAIRFGTIDSTVSLTVALLVNSAMLILAAATFHRAGQTQVAELGEAYKLLTPLLGGTLASVLFGVALLASAQNATITGTLAGQVVMQGFLNIRLPDWLLRLTTRAIAIVPAVLVTVLVGERGTAELLVLSQVILSLQLSFAVFPLVMFTSDRLHMGEFVSPLWLKLLAWLIALVIGGLNAYLLVQTVRGWFG
ncbi:Nramp family divalent metal transporter [Deinococcus sonorensis]|uniref:Divalent metal cation transporter MntH n=2 Tax=Deinococcus sonorensis TaxID=309891 RepID=A0AAU7UC40_9DEIO